MATLILTSKDPTAALAVPRLERGRHAAAQIYEILRDAILALALPPGALLSRVTLADKFRVSSTPIRDALMKLEAERLVEVFAQHATVVSPIDVSLADQAHFLRRAIETEVMRTLAPKGDAALAERLAGIIERQRTLHRLGDFERFVAEDQLFHRTMFEAAEVPDLWDLVRSRSGHLDRLRRLHLPAPGKVAAILADHAAIVAALKARDADGAEAAMRRHLSNTLANVEDIRARYPDYLRG